MHADDSIHKQYVLYSSNISNGMNMNKHLGSQLNKYLHPC